MKMVAALGRAAQNPIKSSTCLNLRKNKSVNPPSYEYSTVFRSNRLFLLIFFPEISALGGRNCAATKKFPQHVSQKLLILLTLLREAAAAAPIKSSFVPCLCRFCAASPPAGPIGERFVAEYY
jgi:hypothetical protein